MSGERHCNFALGDTNADADDGCSRNANEDASMARAHANGYAVPCHSMQNHKHAYDRSRDMRVVCNKRGWVWVCPRICSKCSQINDYPIPTEQHETKRTWSEANQVLVFYLEAGVGIEPASTALQAAA